MVITDVFLLNIPFNIDWINRGIRATIKQAASQGLLSMVQGGRLDVPLFQILEAMGASSFNAFDDFEQFCNIAFPMGIDENKRKKIVFFLECMLIEATNQQLQTFYQSLLSNEPSMADANTKQKLAYLASHKQEIYNKLYAMGFIKAMKWLGNYPGSERERCALRNLSSWFFGIKRLNFRFTFHCNASCAHCYNWSGPRRKLERIDDTIMTDLIAQMPDIGVTRLSIAGGEPLLYLNTVCSLIFACRKHGINRVSIITNGYWASSDERCKSIMLRLKASGFKDLGGESDNMRISTGDYHKKFIDIKNVLTAIKNYFVLFHEAMIVHVELCDQNSTFLNLFKSALINHGLEDKVDIHVRQVYPLGRAAGNEHVMECANKGPDQKPCPSITEIVFDADGKVRPCCGLNYGHDGILIGRLEEQAPLVKTMMRLQNDPLLQAIATHPMKDIKAATGTIANNYRNETRCIQCREATENPVNHHKIFSVLSANQQFFPLWFDAKELHSSSAQI